jgi:hypothetical protein
VSSFFFVFFQYFNFEFLSFELVLLFMCSKVLNAIVSRITYPIYKSDWRIDPCIPRTRYTSSRKKALSSFLYVHSFLLIFLVYSCQDSSKKKKLCTTGFSPPLRYIYPRPPTVFMLILHGQRYTTLN